MDQVKSRILEIFMRTRENRDSPYDENHFFKYLDEPNPKASESGEEGWQHGEKFDKEIELEFCICFPYDFYYDKWSMTKFAAYVDKRMRKPDVNLKMARKKMKDSDQINLIGLVIICALIALPFFLISPEFGVRWVFLILSAAFAVGALWQMSKDFRYYNHLVARIERKMAEEANNKSNTKIPAGAGD